MEKRVRKAQAQIIVTVLIILLVLAIIGVVAMMVTRTVKRGTEEAGERADCLQLDLTIARAVKGEFNVTVERGIGDANLNSIRLYINGELNNQTENAPEELESMLIALNKTALSSGIPESAEVKIAAVLDGDVLCDFSDIVTVAAA